jgi:HD-GYP domain-containing protein (c-di-GMP phosphodiesterase class II)
MRRTALDLKEMAELLARRMGLPQEEAAEAARVAVLRDVGKAVLDDGVLGKPGPLNDAEWELVSGSLPRRKGSPTSHPP